MRAKPFGLLLPLLAATVASAAPLWTVDTKHDLVRLDVGANGTVVFARDGDELTGLSTADGQVRYERSLPGFDEKGYWGRADDTTYVYTTKDGLVGIDVATGQDRWTTPLGGGISATKWVAPVLGHPRASLLSYANGVTVWDLVEGKILWKAGSPLDERLVPNAWGDASNPRSGVLVFLEGRTVLVGPDGREMWSAADSGNVVRGGKEYSGHSVEAFGNVLLVHLQKQVAVLNAETGEVLASQAFGDPKAAADVEPLGVKNGDLDTIWFSLGGRLVVIDSVRGAVVSRTPEGSVVGQAAAGTILGDGDVAILTVVRGDPKAADAGMHLYRTRPSDGTVLWHAANGAKVEPKRILSMVLGAAALGPVWLPRTNGILLATEDKGVRLYGADDGKERWAWDEGIVTSFTVTEILGGNSFAILRAMTQNRMEIGSTEKPVEGEGTIFVASDDHVTALDAATGKPRWTGKEYPWVSGLALEGDTLVLRTGKYVDQNDLGAELEEPEVYVEEDPYGFAGLDPATGAERWKCDGFEPRDPAFAGPMPKDGSICGSAKEGKGEAKACRPGKLGAGSILAGLPIPGGALLLGKSGTIGVRDGECRAAFLVEGSAKKLESVWNLSTKAKVGGLATFGPAGQATIAVAHYGDTFALVDLRAMRVAESGKKASTVKLSPQARLLFAAEGSHMAAYRLP